jgi:DNA segregation ATPase FtsK/SpoIIIE-like protein
MSIRFIRTLVVGLVVVVMSAAAFAQVGLMITIAPPPLPVYEQPVCPEEGYIWTPGFWAYDSDIDDYYWVPGTWVLAPEVGYLWTPAYWGWGGDRFVFYDGYWGPLVGFYGGINYGFGYFGVGFEGGRWDNGHFFYNRAVNNVDVTIIHNVYVTNVENRTENRVSYNGGEGGLNARPTPQQEAAARERHLPPVAAQTQHMQEARSNPQQRASVNHGKPEVAATPKPGAYKDRGVVQAKAAGGAYNPPANRGNRGGNQGAENGAGGRPESNAGTRPENNPRPEGNTAPRSYSHVRELPPPERPSSSRADNSNQDRKYQQQQEKLYSQQQKERQKVAQQQEREDQRIAQQNNDQAKQQMEQRHQQQTQQMQQRHQQQQQQIQQRQPPRQQEAPSRKPPN